MTKRDDTPGQARGILERLANLSLRAKLALAFLLVAALSISAVIFPTDLISRRIFADRAGQHMQSLAHSEALSLGSSLSERVKTVQFFAMDDTLAETLLPQNNAYLGKTATLAADMAKLDEQWKSASDSDPLIQARLNNELAVELKRVGSVFPDLVETMVTDRYGGLAAISRRVSDYYQADEGWWQAAFDNGLGAAYIGEPEFDESRKMFILDIAVPVYKDQEVIGIVRMAMDMTALINFTQVASMVQSGAVDLLLPGGKVVATDDISAGFETVEGDTLERLLALPTGSGYTTMVYDDVRRVIGISAVNSPSGETFIDQLGWHVVVEQDETVALAAVYELARSAAQLGLIITLLPALVGTWLGRQLSRPILDLTRVVSRFSTGDLNARAPVSSRDETGMLASAFNQMAEQTTELLQNFESKSEELEGRTTQLEASQRALQVVFSASGAFNPDELLGMVVNLIRDRFNLYHVQVYLVDGEAAVLRQSTGYAGQQLLLKKHQIPLDRTSLVTQSIHEDRPVLSPDVRQDPNFLANPLLPDTRSELAVPLKVGERVIGALDAQSRTLGFFNPDMIALFETMTAQIGILLQNSELFTRVSEQAETLSSFTSQLGTAAEVGQRINTILDPRQLLSEVVELIRSRFGLYHVHVYLLEPASTATQGDGGQELVIQAGSGEVGKVLRERRHSIPLDREKSLVTRAARSRQPIVVNDTSLSPDFMPNPLLPQTRSEMAVPLIAGERVLGVLDVQDDQPERFGSTDQDTLNTLAGQIATALENARLFAELELTAERLREADRFKSEFLANMSHELRTPLNSIIGYSEVLLMGIDGAMDPETAEDVQAIYDNGHHLLRLINDVLDLAKIEAGHMPLHIESVDLDALLDEVKTNATGLIHRSKKPIELKVTAESDLPLIQADRLRLSQVLNNLVSNAVKFTEQGYVHMRASRRDKWACIQVQDTGAGMSEEELGKIFDKYRQVDRSAARRAEGTGLGLTITRYLVEMHGGTITVQSNVNEGSTFTVLLPISDGQPKETDDQVVRKEVQS